MNVVGFLEVMDFSWFSEWLKTVPYLGGLLKHGEGGLGESAADLQSNFVRLGSAELVGNLGFPLLLGSILGVLCCFLLALSVAFPSQQIDLRQRQFYEKIKRRVYWNLFVRYLFHTWLYIQVGAGVVAALIIDAQKVE